MTAYKFNPEKMLKLNDPARFEQLPPELFWRAMGTPDGPSVIVKIGAGTGLFASAFAGLAPGATIYAADTEDIMLEWMTANRPEAAAGRIVPVKAEETHVPLDDGVADALYMINLHHELVHPEASYAEAFRLLKPGGRLLVVDWAPRDTPKGPPPEVRVQPDTLAGLLEAAGFSEVAVDVALLPWHVMATARR